MKITDYVQTDAVKFIGTGGKRGGISYYQVVDDSDMDDIIANYAGSAGYSVLEYSAEYENGRIHIYASKQAMLNEVVWYIDNLQEIITQDDDEDDEEYSKRLLVEKKKWVRLAGMIESGKPPAYELP